MQHKELVDSVCNHVSKMSVDLAEPVPDEWDSAAFCSNLLHAVSGDMAEKYFPGSKALIIQIKRNFERMYENFWILNNFVLYVMVL